MSIGVFGIVAIIISIFIINKPEKILLSIVFFTPFCASSVISFSSFYLQPGHYFVFMYLAISILSILYIKNCRLDISLIKLSDGKLFAFIVIALLSIILAWICQIDVLVYGIGNGVKLKSSLVSKQNWTQFIYLFLGYVVYLIIFNYSAKDSTKWEKMLKVFCFSGIIVLLIGLYQVYATAHNLPYDTIFRNSVKNMWQTMDRVQATFGEASFLGQYCTYLVALYISYDWTKNKLLKITAFVLVIVVGIMSRSTTFFIGAIVVLMCYVLLKKIDFNLLKKYIALIIITPSLILYFVNNNAYVQKIIDSTYAKLTLNNHSGEERNMVFNHMLNVGFQYPCFGIGYGGGRSTDLYANLLSNVGIFGTLFFLGFVIIKLINLIKHKNSENVLVCILLLVGFLITSTSIPDLGYLSVWVIFGLIDSKCLQLKNNK